MAKNTRSRKRNGRGSEGELDWVYAEELDIKTAYWWSPDSSAIAYLEMDERKVSQYPMVDFSSPSGSRDGALSYGRRPQSDRSHFVASPNGGNLGRWTPERKPTFTFRA